MAKNREFYLAMLAKLLLEIRNLDDTELRLAKPLAYIFHNIPMLLQRNFSDRDGEHAWFIIMGRAEYFRLAHVVSAWEKSVDEQLTPPADYLNRR